MSCAEVCDAASPEVKSVVRCAVTISFASFCFRYCSSRNSVSFAPLSAKLLLRHGRVDKRRQALPFCVPSASARRGVLLAAPLSATQLLRCRCDVNSRASFSFTVYILLAKKPKADSRLRSYDMPSSPVCRSDATSSFPSRSFKFCSSFAFPAVVSAAMPFGLGFPHYPRDPRYRELLLLALRVPFASRPRIQIGRSAESQNLIGHIPTVVRSPSV